MTRPSDIQRRYLFAFCHCRPSQPFRGKQIKAHAKQYKDHQISKRVRVCLADLEYLSDKAGEAEIEAFHLKHASCPGGQVSSRKSREFFASLEVQAYFQARQHRHAIESKELDSEDDFVTDDDDDVSEMEEAVNNILGVADGPTFVSEAPPEGVDQVAAPPPTTQPWTDWRTMELPATPMQPPSPQLPPPEDMPDELAAIFDLPPPAVPTSTATSAPTSIPPATSTPAAPPPVAAEIANTASSELTPVVLPAADMRRLSNHALQGRVNSLTADNQRLGFQLQNWKRRADSLKRREKEVQQLESVLASTEKVLDEARRELQKERTKFEAEREEAQKTLEAEREKMAATCKTLHDKDAELQAIAAKLARAEARQQQKADAPLTNIHIPLAGCSIVADPHFDGCQIAAGDGCGHLQLKPAANGCIQVVGYHSVTYSKRPATTELLKPPSTKPRHH